MISLYAEGPGKVEVGSYNCSLTEAKEHFKNICDKLHPDLIKSIEEKDSEIIFKLNWDQQKYFYKLIDEVAKVIDVHSDGPDKYYLVDRESQTEFYVKTGSYYE